MNRDFRERCKGKRRRGAAGQALGFVILNRGRKGTGKLLLYVQSENLVEPAIGEVKRERLIHTNTFRRYTGLVASRFYHRSIKHGKKFAKGKNHRERGVLVIREGKVGAIPWCRCWKMSSLSQRIGVPV